MVTHKNLWFKYSHYGDILKLMVQVLTSWSHIKTYGSGTHIMVT